MVICSKIHGIKRNDQSTIIEKLTDIFGTPKEIVTDRGTAFTSNEFTEFCKENKIRHRRVAVAAPWANGVVERVNRFLKSSLTKLVDSPTDWKSRLGKVQYIINNTHHSVIKSNPAKLMLGYEQRKHRFRSGPIHQSSSQNRHEPRSTTRKSEKKVFTNYRVNKKLQQNL